MFRVVNVCGLRLANHWQSDIITRQIYGSLRLRCCIVNFNSNSSILTKIYDGRQPFRSILQRTTYVQLVHCSSNVTSSKTRVIERTGPVSPVRSLTGDAMFMDIDLDLIHVFSNIESLEQNVKRRGIAIDVKQLVSFSVKLAITINDTVLRILIIALHVGRKKVEKVTNQKR